MEVGREEEGMGMERGLPLRDALILPYLHAALVRIKQWDAEGGGREGTQRLVMPCRRALSDEDRMAQAHTDKRGSCHAEGAQAHL